MSASDKNMKKRILYFASVSLYILTFSKILFDVFHSTLSEAQPNFNYFDALITSLKNEIFFLAWGIAEIMVFILRIIIVIIASRINLPEIEKEKFTLKINLINFLPSITIMIIGFIKFVFITARIG